MRRTRPPLMRLGTMPIVLIAVALLLAGCLDVLAEDEATARVADAATATLPVPLRSSEPHWFLRQQPGWSGAHLATYGGDTGEPLTVVRVARFRDTDAARAAFARLTPDFTERLWGRRMDSAPRIVRYPFTFPGDEVRTTEYRPLSPPDEPDQGLTVQLIVLRAGRMVIVIESIGVPRDQLPSVAASLVQAAREIPR